MNNFNPMNAPRLARETFAAALDAEFQSLTGAGVRSYFSPLEINRLFNHSQTQSVLLQNYAKLQAKAIIERQQQTA